MEYNAKFQAIQAAHEILNDPTQRVRYDTDRIRAGFGKFYGPSGAHNIPRKPSAAGANYTPNPSARPQRKPPFSARPDSFQNANAGGPGARRYESYSRGGPQKAGQKGQDHGQTRADAFRGFQDMKGSGSGWSQFDPRTGRSGYSGSTRRGNDGRRPKSAYEHFRESFGASNEANAQSPKKKQGFAPNTPGGDEPMAPNTSAYSNTARDRANRWSGFYESVPSPTARKPAPQAAQAQADKNRTYAERESRGYASTGGEKTFFASAAFGRSASMRDSPRSRQTSGTHAFGPDTANAGRHRSASPKAGAENTSSDETTSSSDTEDGNPAFGKRVPRSRLRAREKYAQYRAAHERKSQFGAQDRDTAGGRSDLYVWFPFLAMWSLTGTVLGIMLKMV